MAETASVEFESLSDRALLRMFAQSGDADAFRQLVDRHSALVLGTCRRGLHGAADADDAFQATFLVLARSAGKIRNRDALAAWLYGVATRVCQRMRREAAQHSTHELMDVAAEQTDPLDELLARHDEMVADEELTALPANLRAPLVLRYLAGKSNAEVADELGITVAALEGRLKRGKQRLRMRLLRRGVTLAAVVATLKATRVVASEVPTQLTESAVELAASGASATISSLACEPTTSTHFALQELHAMNAVVLSKPVVAALSAGAVVVAMVTTQVAFSQGDEGAADPFGLDAVAADQLSPDAASEAVNVVAQDDSPFDNADARTVADDPFAPSPGPRPTTAIEARESKGYQKDPPPVRFVDLKQRSWSEQNIENALARPLSSVGLDFHGAPLSEVVDFLRAEYDIEIQLDRIGLVNEGLSPDEQITVSLQNISLESALNLMLEPVHLTYIVDNEVLLITSENRALESIEARAYPTDVLGTDSEELAELIKETIAPDSWFAERKGLPQEKLFTISTVLPDRIVVRQTYYVHREINKLLTQLQVENSKDKKRPMGPIGGQQLRSDPPRKATGWSTEERRERY